MCLRHHTHMTIVEKILDKIGLERKAASFTSTGMTVADPFLLWRNLKKVDPQKAFEVFSGYTAACIRAIAEDVAAIPLELYTINKAGDYERQYDHELLDILDAVNPQQTGLELKYNTAAHLESVGNAYWLLDGVKTDKDKPRAIYLLDPSRTRVIAKRDDFPYTILGYELRLNTTTKYYKPHEILHIKYPDPSDPIEGIGTVQTAAQWIDADNYAQEFNRRFFLNGARIGGFLESESAYTPEQLEYLKKSFENIFKGVENAYRVAALPKGTTYKPGGETQKDMDFGNLMDRMGSRILAAFRVPKSVLGITEDVNRANAEATNYIFALRTIKPKMRLITTYINEFLVPRYGDNLHLDFEDPVPENRELRIQEMAVATGNQPVMSINEAREEYFGLDPVDRGENVMTDFSKIPLGAPKPKAADRPTIKRNGIRAPITRAARIAKTRKTISLSISEAITKELENIETKTKEIKNKNITTLTDEEYDVVWKNFAARVDKYEKLAIDKIREHNKDTFKEVRENLEQALKSKDISPDKLLDIDKRMALLVDLLTPLVEDLAKTEGAAAAELLGIADLNILNDDVKKALARGIQLMSESYNKTTLSLLQEKINASLSSGASLDDLESDISQIEEFSDEVRAAQVARTETFRVANEATKEAWKQTGVVKTIKFYTAADERVCPFCEPLHGKVIGIEENFFEKGDEITGSDGSTMKVDYDDIGTPPIHPSCRCYTRPSEISID